MKKQLIILSLISVLAGTGFGQTNQALKSETDFSSPRTTAFTFIHAIKSTRKNINAWPIVLACFDFSEQRNWTELQKRDVATQLAGILNRIGRVEPEHLPSIDELRTRQKSFTFFPNKTWHNNFLSRLDDRPESEIVFQKMLSGQWLFSTKTVTGIKALYEQVKAMKVVYGKDEALLNPSMWIRGKLPVSLVKNKFVGLAYWQWIGLFLLIFIGLVLDFSTKVLLRIYSNRTIKRYGGAVRLETVKTAVKPGGLFVAAIFWLFTLPFVGLVGRVDMIVYGAVHIFATFVGIWYLWSLTDVVVEFLQSKAARTENKYDDILIPLIRKAIKIFIFIAGFIYMANSLEIPIKPFLASLGIGGLAFAFAAKDTIENLFGSIAVLIDRPFMVGDWVVIGKVEGTVEEVGFRSTRIRTFYDSQITVPNAKLVSAEVDNMGRRRFRRFKCHLGVQYNTPPDKIVTFTEGIRKLVLAHPATRKDYFHVYMNQFSDSSLDILLYVFFAVPDWAEELRERERLILDIVRLAEKLGVSFAFPTRTLHLSPGPTTPFEQG